MVEGEHFAFSRLLGNLFWTKSLDKKDEFAEIISNKSETCLWKYQ